MNRFTVSVERVLHVLFKVTHIHIERVGTHSRHLGTHDVTATARLTGWSRLLTLIVVKAYELVGFPFMMRDCCHFFLNCCSTCKRKHAVLEELM